MTQQTDHFADLTARLDPPLVIVTTAAQGFRAGCVVGFHSQCSISPARYALWISKANFTYRIALLAEHFVMHRLDTRHHALARLFGGTTADEVDKFVGVAHLPGPSNVPILTDCPDRVVLERVGMWDDGGDHVCFVGAPIAVDCGSAPVDALRVSDATDFSAGHDPSDTVPRRTE
jgi:flavin reductase (DIM6/NTAB) family NADH-FMN oxidoreductase RutF